jgi:5-methylcytosine-specific restriction endonuclease McrA
MDTCLVCKKSITQPQGSGRRKKYCSPQCQDKFKNPRKPKEQKYLKEERKITLTICEGCGVMFEAGNNYARFCSRKCQRLITPRPIYQKVCIQCKKPFEATNRQTKYCSSSCANEPRRLAAIERAENEQMPHWATRNNWARNEWRRKQLIRKNWVEDVKIEVLIERDKGICQLCFEPVLIGAPNNHSKQPTQDHIIPLSKGGEESYANSQLACRHCNNKKNNRTEVKTNVTTKQKRKSASPQVAN